MQKENVFSDSLLQNGLIFLYFNVLITPTFASTFFIHWAVPNYDFLSAVLDKTVEELKIGGVAAEEICTEEPRKTNASVYPVEQLRRLSRESENSSTVIASPAETSENKARLVLIIVIRDFIWVFWQFKPAFSI